MGFISLPLPGLGLGLWLKAATAAVVLVFGAYHAGLWIGDDRGYARKGAEVAAALDAANKRIDELNLTLDAEREGEVAKRDVATAEAFKSLADITPEVRKQCALQCSTPEQARIKLGEID